MACIFGRSSAMPHGPAIGGKMSSDEWVESGRDISGVGRLGYDDNQPTVPTTPGGFNLSPYALDPSYLPEGPEFIFPVEIRHKSWNDTWFDRVGTCYMVGLGMGGVWGLVDGLRSREVVGSRRLRATTILNGLTRRGPFLANTTAVVGLMYSPLESLITHYRGKQHITNSFAAAAITGAVFKSTAGPRAMFVASAVGCALIGVWSLSQYLLNERTPTLFNYS